MPRLQMPAGLSGPLRDLMTAIHELHARAGWPSVRELAKGQSFSHFTVHQMFTRPALPNMRVYMEVVRCLARLDPRGGEDEICDRMDHLWLAAYHYPALDVSASLLEQQLGDESTDSRRSSRDPVFFDQHLIASAETSALHRDSSSGRHPDLPDPDASSAVIVSVSQYDDEILPNLPTVHAGAQDLHHLLSSSSAVFPQKAVASVCDGRRTDVLDAIYGAADKASDTLLLYYAGHGLLTAHGELNLAASDYHHGRDYTAVAYDQVREILATSRARRKVVILDCCYSGRATQHAMGTLAGLATTSGAFVLTSTSTNRASIATSPDGQYTAFTGALLEILNHGVRGGAELLDLHTIHDALVRRLAEQGLPQPSMSSVGAVRLALGQNPGFDRAKFTDAK